MFHRNLLIALALASTLLSACGGTEDHSHHEQDHEEHDEASTSDRLTILDIDSGEALVQATAEHRHGELPPIAEDQSLSFELQFADADETPLDLSGNLHAELRFADGDPEDIVELSLEENILTLTSLKRGQTFFHVQLFEDDELRFESPGLVARVVSLGEEHIHEHGDISSVELVDPTDDALITSIEGDAYAGEPLQLSPGASLTFKVHFIGESGEPTDLGEHVVLAKLTADSPEGILDISTDVDTVTLEAQSAGDVELILVLDYYGMPMHTTAPIPVMIAAAD